MITIRRSGERRFIANDNQKTRMTFDPENPADPIGNGFGALRIFNEEVLKPGRAFLLHTPKEAVIVTYVHEGVVIYYGPLDKNTLLRPGSFHRIKAQPGAEHYLAGASTTDDARVFRGEFAPGTGLMEPEGRKKHFTLAERKGVLKLIASPDGKEASLKLQQDVEMYSTLLNEGNHMIHELKPGRRAWLHVVKGAIRLGGLDLKTGDGAGFTDVMGVSFTAQEPSEILLFDLA